MTGRRLTTSLCCAAGLVFSVSPVVGQELFSEQVRVTAGLGYVVNQVWSVELRYTRQRSRDILTEEIRTTDNIFDLRIRTSIRIRDLLKSR